MDPETIERINETIERHEGGRYDRVYEDSEGHPTIGIGFNLDREDAREKIEGLGLDYDAVKSGEASLTDAQIDTLFAGDVDQAIADARNVVTDFDGLSADRQLVLADMAFNLGGEGLAGFHNMIEAINEGDWATASDEMLDSHWAQQVGSRATDDADLMAGDES